MHRFRGKTIIVTGAASGLGAASVRHLHQESANVVALDLQLEDLEQQAAVFDNQQRFHPLRLDVADHAQVAAVIADIAGRFGDLWGLVNCAGITQRHGTPASSAHSIIFRASWGLVANFTCCAIPAASQRGRSFIH